MPYVTGIRDTGSRRNFHMSQNSVTFARLTAVSIMTWGRREGVGGACARVCARALPAAAVAHHTSRRDRGVRQESGYARRQEDAFSDSGM